MYKIFLDSSVIIAYILSSDVHHKDVYSLLIFIKEKYISQYNLRDVFLTNEIIVLEAISKLVHKGYTVSKAMERVQGFLKKYQICVLNRGRLGFLKNVYKSYQKFKRKKFCKLQCNDFLIVVDAINSKALLATCDEDFKRSLPKSFKDIYYISSRSRRYRDQFNELTDRFFGSLIL